MLPLQVVNYNTRVLRPIFCFVNVKNTPSLDAEVESIIWSFEISFHVSQEHIVKLNIGEQFKQR
jgi:hypothetical protein